MGTKIKKIPGYAEPCFPSCRMEDLDLEKDKELIITRILNYGTPERIKWLYSVYSNEDIKEVILNPRRGVWFPKVLNFWEITLKIKIPEEKKNKAVIRIKDSGA